MKRYFKFIALFISVLSLFVLFAFKTIPSGKLWKGFNILYVPSQTQESIVLNSFTESKITEHYELSTQYIPLNFSAYSPEISMLRLNASSQDYSYLSKRQLFFFDKSGNYKLYYIPTSFKNNLNDCIKILLKNGIKCGVDNSANYPGIVPLVVFLLFLALFIFSKKKNVFFAGAVVPFFFILCNPFYSAAVSVCLVFLCLFFLSNIWRREGFLSRFFKNSLVPLLLFFSILGAFSSSIKIGFMFLISFLGCVCSLYFINSLESFLESKKSFVPLKIRTAKRCSVYGGKQKQSLISCISVIFVLIVIAIFSSSAFTSSKFTKIFLPSANASSSELVSLEDYYDFAWKVSSYPYKSLNDENSQNEKFYQYPHYEEDDDGKIVETMQIKSFNDSFKTQTFDEIDLLGFNAIEKVLKKQDSNAKFGYSSTSSYHIGFFGIIVMFISLCILLFVYIFSIIRKGAKR